LSVIGNGDKAQIAAVLQTIAASMGDTKVKEMIDSPIISTSAKVELIIASLGQDADSKLVNFIKVIGEKKRLDLIPAISKVMNALIQKESNEYEGVIKSKTALDQASIENLEATMNRYTGSQIKLKQVESNLDGLRVSVDDLGIEVNFSKERVKDQLIDFIKKSL
jgi:F-type H+-transporting ATPase subunit delta